MRKFGMVELFSGIGAQAKAFSRVAKRRNVEFSTLKTCEWDIHAIIAYFLIHAKKIDIYDWSREKCCSFLTKYKLSNDGKKLANFKTIQSLNLNVLQLLCTAIDKTHDLVDVTTVKGEDIPNKLDVMTYSFPCQDLSNVGNFHHKNKGIDRDAHSRSGLLWEVERILKERKSLNLDMPKFLILENVTALEAKRHLHNFEDWQNQLVSLGYKNEIFKLDALNLGIPQHRKRLIMLSVFVGNDKTKAEIVDNYFKVADLENLKLKMKPLEDMLRINYNKKDIFEEAKLSQPKGTPSRLKIWNNNLKIFDENGNLANNSATITTKQDRHPNSGNLYFDYKNNKRAHFRFLTPRECFLLMGFDEYDYEKVAKRTELSKKKSLFFARDKMYKLAGNSIVVNVLEQIFNSIVDLDNLFSKKSKTKSTLNDITKRKYQRK